MQMFPSSSVGSPSVIFHLFNLHQVEDRIKFDVYKQFLQRDSKLFSALLKAPSSHPDGIYRVPGLKIHEFESLLEFFYEG